MSGRKHILITLGFAAAVGLLASAVSGLLFTYHYSRLQFDLVNVVCGEVVEQEPEARKIVSAALKEFTDGNPDGMAEDDILGSLGYRVYDFEGSDYGKSFLYIGAGFLAGVFLIYITFLYRNKKEAGRIQALAEYLEQANTGRAAVLSATGEDGFSKLEDEIYKTVTSLYQTRDRAVQARDDFAENLSNIAHQIKTPITAMSLSVQMMKQALDGGQMSQAGVQGFDRESKSQAEERDLDGGQMSQAGVQGFDRERKSLAEEQDLDGVQMSRAGEHASPESHENRTVQKNVCGSHLKQVEKQLSRLAHLEEALLVLSRIDAGTLVLQKKEVDVFTLLVLAADNLQEFFAGSGTSVDIPELGAMTVVADLDWTMEAVMNLMKNCLEHGNGGRVHCSCAQNPLYTEILIWDEGEGFAKEDIPHLFERFYRGKNAGEGGIGIGLALAREIIQRQNGTIRARNRPEGGACFEIRFYVHLEGA